MSRRLRSVPGAAHTEVKEEEEEVKAKEEVKVKKEEEELEEVEEPPPETRRTRSGRRVRTPAALLDSEEPPRTPSRRTRRTVLQELPAVEETNYGEPDLKPEAVAEEKPLLPAKPEPCTGAEPAGGDVHVPRPAAAAETVPVVPVTVPVTVPKKKARQAPSVNPVIPLGKPKSGRVWKDRSKQRFSALLRDKPLCTSWERKMQNKRDKDMVKKFTTQLKDDKAKEKEDKRKRREDNLKRRTENERKSEIVQVIRNTAKIKRMKKKTLRKIEKRDTLALLQKTQKQRVKAKEQKNPVKDLT